MAGLLAYYSTNRGMFRAGTPIGMWGRFFYIAASSLFGNLMGRLAYTAFGNCQEKMANLPANSAIGETARQLNAAGIRLPPYMIGI